MNIPTMQELLEAGVHFGHRVRRGNPKMDRFIYGARDGVHIIDLAKSEEKLKEAIEFAHNLGQNGNSLLILGTKKQAKELIRNLAKEIGTFYLTERWIGGMLTNFEEMRKNIRKLVDLKKEKEEGQLKRYTKREQLLIDRKLYKFEQELGGVADLTVLPDAIFIIDTASDLTAVKEANRVNVKIIGVTDTNSNPDLIDYPIPANDDGIKSIKIVAEAIINAYAEGKKKAKALSETPITEEKEEPKDKKKAKKEPETIEVAIPDEVAVLEEEVEKQTLEESERKTV